jgi:uncharacterized protein YbgA (DUF1722 family)
MTPICLLPTALSELFAQVTTTRQITLADRYGMMAALLDETLSLEDRQALDRVLYWWRRGKIQLVAELSALQ